MDPARRAYHNLRFEEAKRLTKAAFLHHDLYPSEDDGHPFCARCGLDMDSPSAMLSYCSLAPVCPTCHNLGIVRIPVGWTQVDSATWRPTWDRLPCPDHFEFVRELEEEFWDVVGEERIELSQKRPKPIGPRTVEGVA